MMPTRNIPYNPWLDLPSEEEFLRAASESPHTMPHENAEQLAAAIVARADTLAQAEFEDLCSVADICKRSMDGETSSVTPSMIVDIRRSLRRPFEPDGTVESLWLCQSVDAVLDWLLDHGKRMGVRNIRFYPLHHDRCAGYCLASYASAGHDTEIARRLRVGQITKFLVHAPLKTHDSFWCLALGIPTLFIVDEECATRVECRVAEDTIPIVRVSRNNCMNVLAHHNSDAWVDFVLWGGRVPTGKLSCDLADPLQLADGGADLVGRQLSEMLLQFAGYVQLVAARLEVLYRQELQEGRPEPSEIGGRIFDLDDTEESLFTYCAEELPRLLKCRYGSILTRCCDSRGVDVLVFQKTSYLGSKGLEKIGTYELSEDALTAWVARTGRSICLQDLGDDNRALLKDKLREYEPNLKWANKIPDSDNHGDLLIVPVWYKQEVIAVLRYTSCFEGHFTEREQRWLEQIARKYVGPKLECVRRHTAERLRDDHSGEIATISVRDAVAWHDTAREIAEQFGTAARTMFPVGPGRKTILFNVVDDDGQHFSHHAVINDLSADCEERYELAGSLTGFALHHPGVVFLADLNRAAEEGVYRAVFKEAVCALACRIGPPDQHPSGVVVVLSDRFDISEKVNGAALKLLSDRAGEILWRRLAKSILFSRSRRTAPLKAGLRRLEQLLSTSDELHLVTVLSEMVDAVDRDQTPFESFEQFRVRDAIELAGSLARLELTDVQMNCTVDPGLHALAPRGFFIAILYDMLRHAWQFSANVAVEATRRRSDRGAWIDVCVECIGQRCRSEAKTHEFDSVLGSLRLSPGMFEFPQSYGLARSYRLRDGRSGDLQIDQRDNEACYRCMFQLPVVSEMPLPSTS